MSSTTLDTKVVADGRADREDRASRAWYFAGIVALAALIAGFYGVDGYSAATGTVVNNVNSNAGRFESVFRDLLAARFRVMALAADVMLQDSVAIEAFAKNDRPALVARIEPFFEQLQKRHSIEQLNFWTPPARIYFRGGQPNDFGADFSKYRRTIVAANERQQRVQAIEIGSAGHVDVRAIVPVVYDGKFIGALELASTFDVPLERASETSGLKWAIGITRETSERVERPANQKTDAWQKDDVFYLFSDPRTAEIVRSIRFDPNAKSYTLAKDGSRTIFVKTFTVVDFAGARAIAIATLQDVSEPFSDALRSVLIKAIVLFVAFSLMGCYAYVKFGQVRDSLTGLVGRQRKELAERIADCEVAKAKLKEVDFIKRGFFTNLVTAINEPLQAVTGQLSALAPAVEKSADQAAAERLRFVLAETGRLSRLVEDYQQVELFRQHLVKAESTLVPLAAVVARAVEDDLAAYRRLPNLAITATIPADLPPTRADPDLLRRAVANLAAFAAQRSGQGTITIAGSRDAQGWLTLAIAGSAFSGPAAPSEALLDEARQFLARIGGDDRSDTTSGALIGIVLARMIVEFYGGSLSVAQATSPGFIVRLPAAA